MRNFFYRLSNAIARFMYGRNGYDQLNTALMVAYLVLWLAATLILAIVDIPLLAFLFEVAINAILVAVLWRCMSKNLAKRQEENRRFLAWWYPTKNRLMGAKARFDDKDHKYFTCKTCKTVCRVPAGKGKIVITCPKCGSKISGKS